MSFGRISLLWALIAIPLLAQQDRPIRYFPTAPSGSCTVITPLWNNWSVGGHLYRCVSVSGNSGTWQIVDGGGGGSGAFSALTGGTNTTAAMLVGTGASLDFTGSGYINAGRINGVILTGLTTGLVKLTAGVPSIATGGDFPTPTDATLSTSDITTNNCSAVKHGFAPKAPSDATKYLDGTCNYSTPAGSGGSGFTPPTVSATSTVATLSAGKAQFTITGVPTAESFIAATITVIGGTDNGYFIIFADPNAGSPVQRCYYSGLTMGNYTVTSGLTGSTCTALGTIPEGAILWGRVDVASGVLQTPVDYRGLVAPTKYTCGSGCSISGGVITVSGGGGGSSFADPNDPRDLVIDVPIWRNGGFLSGNPNGVAYGGNCLGGTTAGSGVALIAVSPFFFVKTSANNTACDFHFPYTTTGGFAQGFPDWLSGSTPAPTRGWCGMWAKDTNGDRYCGMGTGNGQFSAANNFVGCVYSQSAGKLRAVIITGGVLTASADVTFTSDTTTWHSMQWDNSAGTANTIRCGADGGTMVSAAGTIPATTYWQAEIALSANGVTVAEAAFTQFHLEKGH